MLDSGWGLTSGLWTSKEAFHANTQLEAKKRERRVTDGRSEEERGVAGVLDTERGCWMTDSWIVVVGVRKRWVHGGWEDPGQGLWDEKVM